MKSVLLIYTVLLQWSRQRKYIAHAEATANTSTPGSYHRLHHSPTQRLTVSAVRPCLCTSGRTLCVPGLYQWSRALPVFRRPQMSHPLQPCRLQWVTLQTSKNTYRIEQRKKIATLLWCTYYKFAFPTK